VRLVAVITMMAVASLERAVSENAAINAAPLLCRD
jgi:hypothetical protein